VPLSQQGKSQIGYIIPSIIYINIRIYYLTYTNIHVINITVILYNYINVFTNIVKINLGDLWRKKAGTKDLND
jgi:hypothetical protein